MFRSCFPYLIFFKKGRSASYGKEKQVKECQLQKGREGVGVREGTHCARGVGCFTAVAWGRRRARAYLETKNIMVNRAPMIQVPALISLTLPVNSWITI